LIEHHERVPAGVGAAIAHLSLANNSNSRAASASPLMIPTKTELSSTITLEVASLRRKALRSAPLAAANRVRDPRVSGAAKPRPLARRLPATAGAVLPRRLEHDVADRLAGLACQHPRELRGFGVADVNLILQTLSSARSG
jgi:hypothetical protein